jgi:hypothetical protein
VLAATSPPITWRPSSAPAIPSRGIEHALSTNEVVSECAVVFVVRNSHILPLDSYDNWKAALEAAVLRE